MFKKLSAWIFWFYKALLWIAGFQSGDYITYFWRREEHRLGLLWFLLVSITQGLVIIFLDYWQSVLRIPMQIAACILIAVVFWHVLIGNVPPGENK